jgi:hypothetical protein
MSLPEWSRSLIDAPRVIIYNHNMFIMQDTNHHKPTYLVYVSACCLKTPKGEAQMLMGVNLKVTWVKFSTLN